MILILIVLFVRAVAFCGFWPAVKVVLLISLLWGLWCWICAPGKKRAEKQRRTLQALNNKTTPVADLLRHSPPSIHRVANTGPLRPFVPPESVPTKINLPPVAVVALAGEPEPNKPTIFDHTETSSSAVSVHSTHRVPMIVRRTVERKGLKQVGKKGKAKKRGRK